MEYLLPHYQQAVEERLEILCEVDLNREKRGQKPLGGDLLWHVLGFLAGWQLLNPERGKVPIEESAQESFDTLEQNNWEGDIVDECLVQHCWSEATVSKRLSFELAMAPVPITGVDLSSDFEALYLEGDRAGSSSS